MHLLYISGLILTISLGISPSDNMCMVVSMSACKKAPGMSVDMTYLLYLASKVQDSIIASSDTLGELASCFVVYNLCGRQSAHPWALFVPSCLSFRNIRYLSTFLFLHMSCPFFQQAVAPLCHVVVITLLVLQSFLFLHT